MCSSSSHASLSTATAMFAYSPNGSADLARRFMKTTVYGFQHRYDSPFIPGGSVDDVQAHNRRASRRQCNRPFRRVRTFADIRRADEQPGRVLIADSHAHRGVVVAGHDSMRRQHAAEIPHTGRKAVHHMPHVRPTSHHRGQPVRGLGHHTDDHGNGSRPMHMDWTACLLESSTMMRPAVRSVREAGEISSRFAAAPLHDYAHT